MVEIPVRKGSVTTDEQAWLSALTCTYGHETIWGACGMAMKPCMGLIRQPQWFPRSVHVVVSCPLRRVCLPGGVTPH